MMVCFVIAILFPRIDLRIIGVMEKKYSGPHSSEKMT